jgi:hypothetical protein
MLRAGMFDTDGLDYLGACLKGVGAGMIFCFGVIATCAPPRSDIKRDSLISRVEQIADIDGDGMLDDFEILRIYDTIGKNPNLSVRSLSNNELKEYLSNHTNSLSESSYQLD